MPPLVGVLHARARAICTARLAALHESATALPSDEAVRWAFASLLLHEVEQIGPGDFDDATEERETLTLAVEGAVTRLRRWLPTARTAVVDGEVARFVAWLDGLEGDAGALPDVPPRRIATTKEYARIARAFQEPFPKGSGTALGGSVRWDALGRVLRERGLRTVWLLHPTTPALSMTVDVSLLGTAERDGAPSWFPPSPTYVVDESLSFFVYVDDAGGGRAGGWAADEDVTGRIAPA